ncbi:hypothetical protein CY34DRAFT_19402 [Suillus luteus UH-Slu-Lm8-n1]|uniref:Uncharacterized protein n=1 Tax=Suillus luteus UH-Slu-Lm8-n1 TaxID=930992 RepID=A0A0D0ACK8_9AGAM|nr:hypothetical protein CY34DRAFT_19402 [Suillus luteus UH-Slu-Lm8-n1]
MSESDACALNTDGSLKDAKDIIFYHDPDDTVPLSTPSSAPTLTGCKPVPVIAGSRRSIRTSKPSARLRDTENIYSSTSQKRALSSANKIQPAHKKVIPSSFDDDSLDDDTGNDTDPLEPEAEDESEPEDRAETEDGTEPMVAQVAKSERTADIRTTFTRHETHWVCNPCKDAGEPESRHIFRGGISTLRTHISCKKNHFQLYKARCQAAGIAMHPRAIPPEDQALSRQSTLDSILITKVPTFTKAGLLEYIMEFIVTEDEALQLVDKPAF